MPRRSTGKSASRRRPSNASPKARTGSSNQLRIIGGQWRGRKLTFADLPGLRPTTDRVRETLFNWLQSQVPGAHVLDLFAGSGALGLEALSRGAEQLVLIDNSDIVTRQLKANLELLEASDRASVTQARAEQWLQQAQIPGAAAASMKRFDLVFLDPPFGKGMLPDCCQALEDSGLLHNDSWIYLEAEKTLQPLPVPAHWRLHRNLTAGQVGCYLFQRETSQTAETRA